MHETKSNNKRKANSTCLIELIASFPGAESVCIAGTFNDWHPQVTVVNVGGNRWAKALSLKPGHHEYRSVVDGRWADAPTASETVADSFGTRNAVLNVSAETR